MTVYERPEHQHYVWSVEDNDTPCVGTFTDYARHWEQSHYTGIGVSRYLWSFDTGEPVRIEVNIDYLGVNHNDYMDYTLSTPDETVIVTIDGRA